MVSFPGQQSTGRALLFLSLESVGSSSGDIAPTLSSAGPRAFELVPCQKSQLHHKVAAAGTLASRGGPVRQPLTHGAADEGAAHVQL